MRKCRCPILPLMPVSDINGEHIRTGGRLAFGLILALAFGDKKYMTTLMFKETTGGFTK